MEEQKNGNSNGKRKKIAITVFAILTLAGAVILFFYLSYKSTHISTDDAYVTGRIHAVAPRLAGTISAVYAEDNQIVKKGDLLFEIDPSDQDARTKEALSAADSERAKLAEQHSQVRAMRAQLELQQANLKQAELDIRRAESLFEKGAISKERLEKTKTGYDVTMAEVRAAREKLRQAESSVGTQAAKMKEKEAKFRSEQLNSEYTKIYAPSDGLVTKKNVETGNRVQVGQPLLAVVALDDIWILANYKETQLEKLRPGQKVEIDVDTYPGETFYGKVDSIMSGTGAAFSLFPPENATGNYVKIVQRIPVKIILDKKQKSSHTLRVGMSVVPTVLIDK
jgi:membrane fusion protein (multidrug efflux system)